MKFKFIIAVLTVATLLYSSCIKQVDLKTRMAEPILVVEGSISTDSMPYTVRLTYTGAYKYALDIPDEFLEKNANVFIKDDLGDETKLTYTEKGIYQTTDPAYLGKVGRSYTITIELKDGKRYISVPEKINAPVPVESYKAKFISDFSGARPAYLQVSVSSNDPVTEQNYYRWTFYSWILRQTKGVPCGFGCIQFEYCYQKITDNDVHILSDASINGNPIKDMSIGKSYIYTYGNHFINIEQQSLTRAAYQFYENYNAQISRTGNTLDPLPAAIKGNVYNEADPSDFALGYFSAISQIYKRAILIPYSITQYFLDLSAAQFIPPDFVACFDYFPNAQSYPPAPAKQYPPPPGWEHADTVKVYW